MTEVPQPDAPVPADPDVPALTASGVPRRSRAIAGSISHRLVLCRIVGLLLLATLCWFASGEGNRVVSAGLVVLAALQPAFVGKRVRTLEDRNGLLTHDVGVLALVAVAAPGLFWPLALALVSLMVVGALVLPLSKYVPIAVAVSAAIAIAGALARVEYFERAVLAAAVLGVVHGLIGRHRRRTARSSRRDLNFAIDAVGALTHVTRLGDGLVEMLGDVEKVVGWPRREWMAMDQFRVVHPDDHDRFHLDVDALVVDQVVDRTGRLRTKDGRWIWIRDVSRVVDAGEHVELHGFTIDVTAQQVGLDRVTAEATTDPLTGLANRRALVAELEDCATTADHHLTLIDLNRFKEVNDTLGHEAGDVLLRVIADRIAELISDDVFLARLGGDEFAIVHRAGVATEEVVAIIETLAIALMRPVEINGVNVSTSISAGVVRAQHSQADGPTMLRHADMAMYAAKREPISVIVFDDDMGDRLERRLRLSTEVAGALAAGEIVLHYQPILDAMTGEITGVEGLARWEHPQLGLLAPSAFLDVILLSDRSGQFTRLMVEQAISAAAHFVAIDLSIPVSVNVPVCSVEDCDFEQWFVQACENASLARDRIVFEVAERDLHDAVATAEAIDRLSDMGVGIAVDDFGTGHATFDRLRWRNVSQIKLDRDIIRNSATEPRDGVIVRSIIDLAHSLGYSVVAEGVEDTDQLEVLRSMGCERIQGYLYSRAVPLDDFVELLRCRWIDPIPVAAGA